MKPPRGPMLHGRETVQPLLGAANSPRSHAAYSSSPASASGCAPRAASTVPAGLLRLDDNDGSGDIIYPGSNDRPKVGLVGSAGVLSSGGVNRDGIGSSISVTPDGGKTSISQVLGGPSYASQDSLDRVFGLGSATGSTVEVLWAGGIRNRLYDVEAGESITFPHIPCDFGGAWKNFGQYNSCVQQALNAYKQAGIISAHEKNRFRDSAVQAYDATH